MKTASTLLTLALILFLFSCQRDLDLQDPPAPPEQTGYATFWAKKGPSGRNIVFSISTITDSITSFSATPPSCNGSGTKTATLPAGTYTWKAYSLSDTITGTITIQQNDCKVVEFVFVDPPSKGKVTFWAKRGSSASSSIVFSINNIKDSITSFTSIAPLCGSIDAKTMQLPVGTYTWQAISSADTLAGEVIVNKDDCALVDLTYPEQAVADTEYIRFKVNGNEGVFRCPPDSIMDASFASDFTSLTVWGSYNGEPENWYGVLIKGPASIDGAHVAKQLKVPGITAGMSDTLKVNITKYGGVGEMIQGNLNGKIRDDFSNSVFDVEMEFNIKRRQ